MVCEGAKVTGPIFITKYAGRACDSANCLPGFFPCDGEPRTTEIRNLRCLSIDVNAPLERFPIPEANDDNAIVIKAYGNQATIQIQWTITIESTDIVRQTLDACGAETCAAKGGVTNGCTKSLNNQVKWWTNVFQSSSIDDRYHLYIGDCTVNPIPNPTPTTLAQEQANQAASEAYHKDGALQNFRVSQQGDSPVTYSASATFYVGRPQGTPNEEFVA